jgi:hypothetical protein
MRTVTIERTYYTVRELQEQPGGGFDRALDEYAQQECQWQDWSDEWASLKALDDAVGYRRSQRWYHDDGLGETSDLTGRRAWAWLENAVLAEHRIPWQSLSHRGKRRAMARHGIYYRAGRVQPCPFTGFYMDEVLLDSLRDSLRAGMSVGDAMLTLEAVVQKVCDEELDYRTSEEAFIEKADDLGWEFSLEGERV